MATNALAKTKRKMAKAFKPGIEFRNSILGTLNTISQEVKALH